MTPKILLLKLSEKKIFFLIFLTIIFFLIYFIIKEKINPEKLLKNIKKDLGISVTLYDKQKWSYYPNIIYKNNLSIASKMGNFTAQEGRIEVIKNYNIKSPFIINYQSPSILYKGINFRNSEIKSEYYKRIVNLNKFTADLIDGKININGSFHLEGNKNIYLQGSYNNISVNRILKQLKVANWERVKIKISSTNFSLNTITSSQKKIINNLNGQMIISGSIFFVSKEEERFSSAFLSLLSDKFISIKPLSKSITYLLDKFADQTSDISGSINIDNGVMTTKKLLINNKKEKALLTGSLNLLSNKINAKIDFYNNGVVYLTTEINGNLDSPNILIGGREFSKKVITEPQNIKEIFEKGIQKLVDEFLNLND